MSKAFEMSAAGSLSYEIIVECGVCWWTYDPSKGDFDHDLLPGVGFSDLPATFRCPACDAPKDKFMIKPDVNSENGQIEAVRSEGSLADRLEVLEAAYLKAEDSMVGLPVHNPKLRIEMVGFQEVAEGYVGVVVTPWCMNLTLLPFGEQSEKTGAIGSKRDIGFPSGIYSFLSARLDGFGALETCSLISPMDDFDDPDVARLTAEAALEGLLKADEPEKQAPKPKGPTSRRAFLRGGLGKPTAGVHV